MFVLGLALCVMQEVKAQGYTYTVVAGPNGKPATIYGINNKNQVVGTYADNAILGFMLNISTNEYAFVNYPGAIATWPRAINDKGQIVGYYLTSSSGPAHSFIFDGKNYKNIDIPNATRTAVYGINNFGKYVGIYYPSGGSGTGFVFNGSVQPISADNNFYTPYAINNADQIAGGYFAKKVVNGLPCTNLTFAVCGFISKGPNYLTIDVPDPPPGTSLESETVVYSINDLGQASGIYTTSGSPDAGFVYYNGGYTYFSGPPGCINLWQASINNSGTIAGYCSSGSSFIANPSVNATSIVVVSPFLLGARGAALANLDLATWLPKLPSLASAAATGLAADGVSAAIALFETTSSDDVTFTSNNGTSVLSYDPTFLQMAPVLGRSTLTVSPIKIGAVFYAAALVQGPLAGVTPAYASPIVVTAQQGAQSGQAALKLVPPPVVLVHGIWGNQTSLAAVQNYLTAIAPWQSQSSFVVPIKYTNDVAFDSVEPSSALNTAYKNEITALDAAHIVGGRLDIVAHSMGGLLVRHYTVLPSYDTPRNRMQGKIHEIITLDTPEAGSLLAKYLVMNADATLNYTGNLFPYQVWKKACGTNLLTTVQECFARPLKLNMPLAPAGQPITSGAVYSLMPGSPSFTNGNPPLPSPNIPNAIWRAVSAVVPQTTQTIGGIPTGGSALLWELNQLIAASAPNQSAVQTIPEILSDGGQDDAIVPVASQISGAAQGNFATLQGLSHSPPGDPGILSHVLSSANVENDATVNNLIGCWLTTAGAASCIPSQPSMVTKVSTGDTSPIVDTGQMREVHRLSVQVPQNIELAVPFELAMRIPTSGIVGLTLSQADELGHKAKEQEIAISRVVNGVAYAMVTPVLMGSVTFSVEALFKDRGWSEQEFTVPVKMPAVAPKEFRGDFNWHTIVIDPNDPAGLNFAELNPQAVYASAPDQKIDLAGRVQCSVVPTSGEPVIRLRDDCSFEALRIGTAAIDVRFGNAVDRVQVISEPGQ